MKAKGPPLGERLRGADRACPGQALLARGIVTLAVAAGLLSGCARQRPASEHETVAGTIDSVRQDTSELSVSVTEGRDARRAPLLCLLTSDAEIYVNDRFAGFDALQFDDQVELIGYRESSSRGQRFVVTIANVTRAEPPPPAPALVLDSAPAGNQESPP